MAKEIIVDAVSETGSGVSDSSEVANRLEEDREQITDVQNAQAPTETTEEPTIEREVPSKFEGKSVDDIVSSYTNLEQQYGRQGNELGELRKLADSLIQKNLNESSQRADSLEQDISNNDFTQDEFFADPTSAVRRIVNEALEPVKANLTESKMDSTVQRLQVRHPDVEEIVTDLGFQEWVMKSSPLMSCLTSISLHIE